LDLAAVELTIAPDGRARTPGLGRIEFARPGSDEGSYERTIGTLIHEIGHLIQMTMMGESNMLGAWHAQSERYGEGAYFIRGTLEFDAESFRQRLLPGMLK